MPTAVQTSIKKLKLDLCNYRTVVQASEVHAAQALISIHPESFWALTHSLLDSGYLPTENILVLKSGKNSSSLVVHEGNRRIAALKLVFGYIKSKEIFLPDDVKAKITALPPAWKSANETVPCIIYESTDSDTVNQIVNLTHGIGEQAGRLKWESVARSRHSRDVQGNNEYALDLLEKYLADGKNITSVQSERWAGLYPLRVLEEAMKKGALRFGCSNSAELSKLYPNIKYRDSLEKILHGVGTKNIGFNKIRNDDFVTESGVPAPNPVGHL